MNVRWSASQQESGRTSLSSWSISALLAVVFAVEVLKVSAAVIGDRTKRRKTHGSIAASPWMSWACFKIRWCWSSGCNGYINAANRIMALGKAGNMSTSHTHSEWPARECSRWPVKILNFQWWFCVASSDMKPIHITEIITVPNCTRQYNVSTHFGFCKSNGGMGRWHCSATFARHSTSTDHVYLKHLLIFMNCRICYPCCPMTDIIPNVSHPMICNVYLRSAVSKSVIFTSVENGCPRIDSPRNKASSHEILCHNKHTNLCNVPAKQTCP